MEVTPAKIFPKQEVKLDGSIKTRILVDGRYLNEFTSTRYKARLNGARKHAELLRMFASKDGESNGSRVPASQSRKELWTQIQRELNRKEREDVTLNEKEIRQRIKHAMSWINKPNLYKKRLREWTGNADNAQLPVMGALGQRATYAELPKVSATATDLTPLEKQNLAERLAKDGRGTAEDVELSAADYSKAYYQVGVSCPSLQPVCWYDPYRQTWRYGKQRILGMGSRFSVPSWLRISNFCECAAALLMRTVSPIYVDDTALIDYSRTYDSGKRGFMKLCEVLGLEMSDKKEATQTSAKDGSIKMLGIFWKFSRDTGMIVGSVADSTIQKGIAAGEKILTGLAKRKKGAPPEKVSRKSIEQLVGVSTYIVCSSACRAGLEITRPLHNWLMEPYFDANIRSRRGRAHLRRLIRGTLAMIREPKPIIIGGGGRRSVYTIITDASGGEDGDGTPWIGGMIWTPTGQVEYYRQALPEKKGANIAELESLAVVTATNTWKKKIVGNDVLVYLDNIVSAYSFIKAGSKNEKACQWAVAQALWGHRMDVVFLYSYLRTDLNCSDALTRSDYFGDLEQALPKEASVTPVPPQPGKWGYQAD